LWNSNVQNWSKVSSLFATKTQKPDIQVLLEIQGTFNNRVFVIHRGINYIIHQNNWIRNTRFKKVTIHLKRGIRGNLISTLKTVTFFPHSEPTCRPSQLILAIPPLSPPVQSLRPPTRGILGADRALIRIQLATGQ